MEFWEYRISEFLFFAYRPLKVFSQNNGDKLPRQTKMLAMENQRLSTDCVSMNTTKYLPIHS